jgi:hypothetical protein
MFIRSTGNFPALIDGELLTMGKPIAEFSGSAGRP